MTTKARLLHPNTFQMPNAYVDLALPHLTGTETKILLYIARKTFGWNKHEERIPSRLIVEEAGVGRSQTFEALAHLDAMHLITKYTDAGRTSSYGLQLDAALFDLPGQGSPEAEPPAGEAGAGPSPISGPEGDADPSGNDHGGSPETGTGTRPETITGTPYGDC